MTTAIELLEWVSKIKTAPVEPESRPGAFIFPESWPEIWKDELGIKAWVVIISKDRKTRWFYTLLNPYGGSSSSSSFPSRKAAISASLRIDQDTRGEIAKNQKGEVPIYSQVWDVEKGEYGQAVLYDVVNVYVKA